MQPIAVFPVVHLQGPDQAVAQARMAFESGADGVYFIDHGSGAPDGLEQAFNRVVADLPDRFIGLNFLGVGCGVEAFEHTHRRVLSGGLARYPDALWVDDALPLKAPQSPHDDVMMLKRSVPALRPVQYLGGVAFKYTRTYTDDPGRAADEARRLAPHVDVVTTSGPGTGTPPPLEKITAMKAAVGAVPLAVASGVDAGSIEQFRGALDKILVASSVETRPYSGVFDPDRLAELIRLAHGQGPMPRR